MKHQHMQGFSLIELMIAIFLSLLILGGVFEVYLTTKTTYTIQQALARMQEKGRFIGFYLSRSIRMAGFNGCDDPNDPVKAEHAIGGYESFLGGDVASGTDSLVIGRCFTHKSQIHWQKIGFYIAKTSYRNQQRAPIYALYQKISTSSPQQLVTGISNMQVRFGVLSPHGQLVFFKAKQISDWRDVNSVDIQLLLQSIDPVLTKPHSASFAGQTLPLSLRLRKPWHIFITLREPLSRNKA